MNTTQRYTKVAIILHWLVGLVILVMFALGIWMSDLPKDALKVETLDLFEWGVYTFSLAEPVTPRAFYFNLHKSIGVTLLALIAFRVYWRITHVPPGFPATMQSWEKKVATAAHNFLYVLMVAMPVSGLLMAINSKYGIAWFGLPLVGGLDNAGMREAFKEVHEMTGLVLLFLIVVHIIAAIKHKIVDKDEIMARISLRK